MAAIGLALMPLTVLSYQQARDFEDEARARWQSALFGETFRAAGVQIDAINRAQGLASAMATAIVPVLDDVDRCSAVFVKLAAVEPTVAFAGFIPPNGQMVCSSTGQPFNFAVTDGHQGTLSDRRPSMTVNRNGPISGDSVLIFSNPVYSGEIDFLGYVSLSMPHNALEPLPLTLADPSSGMVEPVGLVTFDGRGNVLASKYGLDELPRFLPANRALTEFVSRGPTTFRDETVTGDARTFAVVSIVPGSLFVLGSWPADVVVDPSVFGSVPTWGFPLSMWVASLLTAWLATENQVLRHIRALRRSILAFAGGSRVVTPPNLNSAPNELRDVGDAYERMMSSVMHDEAKLEDTIHQKEVLLREVHHRVKNNLQLIASIMNLQIRKALHPEARTLVKGLHDRVMSLATVHRELYQTSGLTDVRADELLETIVAQVLQMGSSGDRILHTETQLDSIRMTPDQAVPLSLIVTEAVTNVLKHARPDPSGRLGVSVTLKRGDPGRATLQISNSVMSNRMDIPTEASIDLSSLGQQLLTAFGAQLGGTLFMGPENGRYVVRLDFPLVALSEAEHRSDTS